MVLDLHLKGLWIHAIHDDLVATLSSKAVAYSTVTRYLREARLSTAEVTLDPEPSSPHLDDFDRAILAALEQKPLSSVRDLARTTHIPRATVYRRLTKSLWFVRRFLRWVPHLRSDAQKVRRVDLFVSLLRMLEVQEQRACHDVITLDESWFDCSTDYESIWLPPGEKIIEMPRVTAVWNPSGFHLIRVLSSGCKFNSSCYRREILESLSEWRREQASGPGRKLIIHANNARPHTAAVSNEFMEENGLERPSHPPYS
jgi:hypothetical protein